MQLMTLREAVEIIDVPCSMLDDPINRYNRARAIVDAAVEFIEARQKCLAAHDAEPFDDEAFDATLEPMIEAEDRFRALERGETQQQQQPKESP